MAKPNEQLRFASLVRVSTEKQARRGESLRTQQKQVAQAVESLGGTVTQTYGGQEHATPGFEKSEVNRLLKDAAKKRKPFDAVIVCDASRWTRDNVANETGLDALRQNGIRFFVLMTEFDLFEPMHRFMLASQATMNQMTAAVRKQKSILNCIERAKRIGAPTSGKPPFGRVWNKQTETWSVDEAKKKTIEEVASRYLDGESLPKLAEEFGINHAFLNKTLQKSCGDSYTITWDIRDLNIHETVEIAIPPLLPKKTIRLLNNKAKANRTFEHGSPTRYRYLLRGKIFCGECGMNLTGQPPNRENGFRYYRHKKTSKCEVTPRPYIRCDQIEESVLRELFEVFRNPAGVERIKEVFSPDQDKINEHFDKRTRVVDELEKLQTGRKRILDLIVKDTISESDAESKLAELKQRESTLNLRLSEIDEYLETMPDMELIDSAAKDAHKSFRKMTSAKRVAEIGAVMRYYELMTDADKESIVASVFSGDASDGTPAGVYVYPIEGFSKHRQKEWRFVLKGNWRIDGITRTTQSVEQCASHSPAPVRLGLRFQRRGAVRPSESRRWLSAAGCPSKVLWSEFSYRIMNFDVMNGACE